MNSFLFNVCLLIVGPDESVLTYQDTASEVPALVMVVADRDGIEQRSCRFSPKEGQNVDQTVMELEDKYVAYRLSMAVP